MPIIELKNDKLTVGINTLGSELAYIRSAGGTEFLWNGDKEVWSLRAPVLFPICGGLKEDKFLYRGHEYHLEKHGFAMEMEFRGTRLCDTAAKFVLESDESTMKQFPFPFRFTLLFELQENTLKVSNIVENTGTEEMFFSVGAHEGYACPEGIEDYEIHFDEKQTLNSFVLNGNLLENHSICVAEDSCVFPLKYKYFAVDALVFKNILFTHATLVHKHSSKRVRVGFDGARYFLLWTKPNAKYICLEPWYGIQDIVGSGYELSEKEGIIRLEAGKSHTSVHTIECFE